ncbi:MAG: gluconate 2-dehydrogenase subunit 3 family protein [Sphingomonadaceae bacterium]|nr:gluconate 2-dehydrogenase subunit 3 family protein [Sphingomonadaceae bacterium]
MPDRFPGYDVLSKRDGQSWNARSRDVIAARLAIGGEPRFFTHAQLRTLRALAVRIVPQPEGRAPIDAAALIDDALVNGEGEGFRDARMPPASEAWRRGLDAFDVEAHDALGKAFADLDGRAQDALIGAMEAGALASGAWLGMPCALFFTSRVLADIVAAYYAHPSAWSAIGFGGPAAPRGYVRMEADRRDGWEAAELKPDDDPAKTIRQNRHVA